MLRISTPWDSQPQEVVEICQDYAPAFVWNPAIGLLTPALGHQLSATGTVTQSVGQHGRAANLAASAYLTRANYAPIVTSNGVWTGDFTAFVIANPPASASPRALLSQRLDGGALSQFNIQANANSAFSGESGTVQFSTNSTASTTTSATGIIDGKYHVFGIRRIGTTLTGWVDGVEVATVTGTARAIGSASAGLGIGIAPPIYNTNGIVDIAFAAGFNVGILDMADVSRNVWRASFAPRTIWVPVSSASSGTSFTITPSGGLTFGGTSVDVKGKILTVSGGVAFSGTGSATFTSGGTTYTITPSGGLVFAGSGVSVNSKVFLPSGGITFGGSGLDLRTKIVNVSGGVVFGGTGSMSSNTSTGPIQTGERTKMGAGT